MALRNRRRPPRAKARGVARNVVEKYPTGLDLFPSRSRAALDVAGGPDGKDYDIPELRGALMTAKTDRDNYMKKIIGIEAEIERLPSDGVDTHTELMALVERAEQMDVEARSEVRSLLSRLITRIDVIRNDWPEWAERETGAIDGLAPEWAVKLLDKSYRIFSVGGQLEPYMLALELRNGRKLGVIASKYTVMLLRPEKSRRTQTNSGVIVGSMPVVRVR